MDKKNIYLDIYIHVLLKQIYLKIFYLQLFLLMESNFLDLK